MKKPSKSQQFSTLTTVYIKQRREAQHYRKVARLREAAARITMIAMEKVMP